jgi:hypothetical protein
LIACFGFLGCAHLEEAGRKVWGSSIMHLESVRASAVVLEVARPLPDVFKDVVAAFEADDVVVYIKDLEHRHVVALGFPGHVDTTEVGVFFSDGAQGGTRCEIASMSPGLRDEVARHLKDVLSASVVEPQ